MKNKKGANLGMNLTGIDVSPVHSKQMREGREEFSRLSPGSDFEVTKNRIRYMHEAEPIGSVPLPATLKGTLKSGAQMLKGNRPQTLIDKLGERLAFERTGTRLYDSLISKQTGSTGIDSLPPIEALQRFRDEEHQHFLLVASVMREIGADPTAMTPGADAVGVASMGLVQLITDPRTTFTQSLEAILIAELADHDGWETLIQLTEEAGLTEASNRFRAALEEETIHLSEVRRWVTDLVREQAGAPKKEAA